MSLNNGAGLPPVTTTAGETKPSKVPTTKAPKAKRQLRGKGPALIAGLSVFLLGAGGFYVGLQAMQPHTVEVYRTTSPLAANQMVTSDDIEVAEVPADLLGPDMLTSEDLNAQLWFAKVGLPEGTPLSRVVLDTSTRTNITIPAGMVLASFEAEPASAVAGKVQAGDYVNITAVGQASGSSQKVARVILNHILVLDANVGAKSQAQTAGKSVDEDALPGPDSPSIYGGIPTLYTVAVTNEQAATLALARDMDLYVTLTQADQVDPVNVTVSDSQVFSSGEVPAGVTPSNTTGDGFVISPDGTIADTPSTVDPNVVDPTATPVPTETTPQELPGSASQQPSSPATASR